MKLTAPFVCGNGSTLLDFDWPDAGAGLCCAGSAMGGASSCTCWEPVYDLEQQSPVDGDPSAPAVAEHPCGDCAYRPDSPERTGDAHVSGDEAMLTEIVESGQPFWCHQGMRRPVAYIHPPTGTRVVPPHLEVAYRPPIEGGIPRRADGTPADLCAGWFARRLRYVQEANDG